MSTMTQERVKNNTSARVNEGIRQQSKENLRKVVHEGEEGLDRRLEELTREWDIERVLEMNAATLSLVGLGLAAFVDRRFIALPGVVMGFLLQHAVQGWCPPLPVFRWLGYRTQMEIDAERHALKAMRGDYKRIRAGEMTVQAASEALAAAR